MNSADFLLIGFWFALRQHGRAPSFWFTTGLLEQVRTIRVVTPISMTCPFHIFEGMRAPSTQCLQCLTIAMAGLSSQHVQEGSTRPRSQAVLHIPSHATGRHACMCIWKVVREVASVQYTSRWIKSPTLLTFRLHYSAPWPQLDRGQQECSRSRSVRK